MLVTWRRQPDGLPMDHSTDESVGHRDRAWLVEQNPVTRQPMATIGSVMDEAISWQTSLEEWQHFVDQHPRRTAFHHRHWLELLSQYYRLPVHVVACEAAGAGYGRIAIFGDEELIWQA